MGLTQQVQGSFCDRKVWRDFVDDAPWLGARENSKGGQRVRVNIIREHKYALDLKHFPCKKLLANQVYALFALIAHNHLKTVALLDNREHPLYAKRLRFKYIFHPGRIVTHARRQILKLATRVMKEIRAMNTAWRATRDPVLARGGRYSIWHQISENLTLKEDP